MTYKPLWEEEKQKREALEKKISEFEASHVSKDYFEKSIVAVREEEYELRRMVEKDAEFGRKVRVLFQELMPTTIPADMPTTTIQAVSLTIAEVDERIKQLIGSGPGPIPVVSVDVDQRIKELVKNEVVNRQVNKIRALPDPAKKAAWWLHEKKQANIKEVYNYVYDKSEAAGRIPGNFYANVINPLVDAWLIINEGGNIRWALQEKLAAELKEVLGNDDLEKVPKYLASLLL